MVWRFKRKKQKHQHFSQEQQTAASVISSKQANKHAITMYVALIFKEQAEVEESKSIEKKQKASLIINTTFWCKWSALLQKQNQHLSIIETKIPVLVPGKFTSSRADKNKKNSNTHGCILLLSCIGHLQIKGYIIDYVSFMMTTHHWCIHKKLERDDPH
jgi:hypothetical protein